MRASVLSPAVWSYLSNAPSYIEISLYRCQDAPFLIMHTLLVYTDPHEAGMTLPRGVVCNTTVSYIHPTATGLQTPNKGGDGCQKIKFYPVRHPRCVRPTECHLAVMTLSCNFISFLQMHVESFPYLVRLSFRASAASLASPLHLLSSHFTFLSCI